MAKKQLTKTQEQKKQEIMKSLTPWCSVCDVGFDRKYGWGKLVYCPVCGAKLVQAILCQICGDIIISEAKFCTNCGVSAIR